MRVVSNVSCQYVIRVTMPNWLSSNKQGVPIVQGFPLILTPVFMTYRIVGVSCSETVDRAALARAKPVMT
jgi:hypothetical protein